MSEENLKMEIGDKYYVITKQREIIWMDWGVRPDFDKRMQDSNNVFLSREEASQALKEGFVRERKVYCMVDIHELAQLLRDAEKLRRLDMAGVDNWIGYDGAIYGEDIDLPPFTEYSDQDDEELTKEYKKTEEL